MSMTEEGKARREKKHTQKLKTLSHSMCVRREIYLNLILILCTFYFFFLL